MTSIALNRTDVIVGVDTHKHEHVAVAIDGFGGRLGAVLVPATTEGCEQIVTWASALGPVFAYGVEGTGSYGIGLARFLRRRGDSVIEVSRPPRKGERRAAGKSDPIDAEHAARQVLAGQARTTPKLADGAVEAIRLVKIARDTAVKAHTQAMVTLKATLVTAVDDLRSSLEPLSDFQLMEACSALESHEDVSDPEMAMRHVLRSLARRWLELHDEIKIHTRQLKKLTKTIAPQLVEAFGIGFDIAAELLAPAGDNSDRVRSESAFQALRRLPDPRLVGQDQQAPAKPRGNRQANAALYRAVIVRMRWHAPTITYVERRTTEGLSKREIISCLKRFLVREVYQLLPVPAPNREVTEAARST